MRFKNFFSDPKVMACSGLFAMLAKMLITSLIITVIMLLTKKSSAAGPFFILIYPIVAASFDLKLHCLKDRLWQLPSNVPEDWDITTEQLLTYAKYLPKVRLMRFASCWIVLLVTFTENWLLLTISAVAVGFFIAALFDWLWLKIFNIKKPKFPIKLVKSSCQYDPSICDLDRLRQEVARNNDPSAVGSIAWLASRHLDEL